MSTPHFNDKTQETEFNDEMMRLVGKANEDGDHHAFMMAADELVKLRRKVKEFARPVVLITLEGGLVRTVEALGLPADAVVIVSDYDTQSADPDDDSLDQCNNKGDMAHIHQEEVLKLDADFRLPILTKYHLV